MDYRDNLRYDKKGGAKFTNQVQHQYALELQWERHMSWSQKIGQSFKVYSAI